MAGVKYQQMPWIRYRWIPPLCNLVIDIVLAIAAVWVMQDYLNALRKPPPLWHQTTMQHFDPNLLAEGQTPQPLKAIALGALPAALISALVLPNGWRASTPFDVVWLSLHTILAWGFWYVIGRLLEVGALPRRRPIQLFVTIRVATIPASLTIWTTAWGMLCNSILLLFWLGAAVYILWRMVASLRPTRNASST